MIESNCQVKIGCLKAQIYFLYYSESILYHFIEINYIVILKKKYYFMQIINSRTTHKNVFNNNKNHLNPFRCIVKQVIAVPTEEKRKKSKQQNNFQKNLKHATELGRLLRVNLAVKHCIASFLSPRNFSSRASKERS